MWGSWIFHFYQGFLLDLEIIVSCLSYLWVTCFASWSPRKQVPRQSTVCRMFLKEGRRSQQECTGRATLSSDAGQGNLVTLKSSGPSALFLYPHTIRSCVRAVLRGWPLTELSAAVSIPEEKGPTAEGHTLLHPEAGAPLKGQWEASRCPPQALTRAWNHQVETTLLAKSSDFLAWQGDRRGHMPLYYNTVITIIEVCLKCQHGFVCKYAERIIYNYMGFKLIF